MLPDMFQCDRIAARLTVGSCARLWRSAVERPPRHGEARIACVGCELGARHAGADVALAQATQRAKLLDAVCVRCGATGRRMVRGLHCISCYNRLREARHGRDARGRLPRFAAAMGTLSVIVITPHGASRRCLQGVSGYAEAILTATRLAGGAPHAIAPWCVQALPVGAQLELWAGLPLARRAQRRGGIHARQRMSLVAA
jgi:hypothetical protein